MVTSRLFEAFLDCPLKCFLRSIGQSPSRQQETFKNWKGVQHESYGREGFKRLSAEGRRTLDAVSVGKEAEMPIGNWRSVKLCERKTYGQVSCYALGLVVSAVQRKTNRCLDR
jgi:hypothetical protein